MSPEAYALSHPRQAGARLAGVYTRVLIWYLFGVMTLWLLGVESIYEHPTPFYAAPVSAFSILLIPASMALLAALFYCAVSTRAGGRIDTRGALVCAALALLTIVAFYQQLSLQSQSVAAVLTQYLALMRWHFLVFLIFCGGFVAFFWTLQQLDWLERVPSTRETAWTLAGMVLFAAVFACAIAMLRGGPQGIAQAYERASYEYAGDIGAGGSIRGLFARYVEIQPHLSMHAKVHPPGPIALLWLLSYVAGRGAMGLSLATVAVAALSVVPLYFWARELAGRRAALTCCALYTVAPAVVLFTATSADMLFMPFTLTTLYLFTRALRGPSIRHAAAAGVGFGLMSILKFSLLGFGAGFAFAGLYLLLWLRAFRPVFQTAAVMGATFLLFHLLLWWWSGFDMVGTFLASKAQFDVDQHHLDQLAPRFPAWSWKLLNPMAWFFFAGIPVSVLFIWRVARPDAARRGLWLVILLTLAALDLLYLARGEGERSAVYVAPLLVVPAGHALHALSVRTKDPGPLAVTLGFLAAQCWLIESYFYTYW
jgi:hypothetical protein